MKQTAVEWLIDQFEKHENGQIDWMSRSATKSEALQMEKEQMIQFANSFYDECGMQYGGLEKSAEQYYNETFNTKEK
jgi:hypothetical protein